MKLEQQLLEKITIVSIQQLYSPTSATATTATKRIPMAFHSSTKEDNYGVVIAMSSSFFDNKNQNELQLMELLLLERAFVNAYTVLSQQVCDYPYFRQIYTATAKILTNDNDNNDDVVHILFDNFAGSCMQCNNTSMRLFHDDDNDRRHLLDRKNEDTFVPVCAYDTPLRGPTQNEFRNVFNTTLSNIIQDGLFFAEEKNTDDTTTTVTEVESFPCSITKIDNDVTLSTSSDTTNSLVRVSVMGIPSQLITTTAEDNNNNNKDMDQAIFTNLNKFELERAFMEAYNNNKSGSSCKKTNPKVKDAKFLKLMTPNKNLRRQLTEKVVPFSFLLDVTYTCDDDESCPLFSEEGDEVDQQQHLIYLNINRDEEANHQVVDTTTTTITAEESSLLHDKREEAREEANHHGRRRHLRSSNKNHHNNNESRRKMKEEDTLCYCNLNNDDDMDTSSILTTKDFTVQYNKSLQKYHLRGIQTIVDVIVEEKQQQKTRTEQDYTKRNDDYLKKKEEEELLEEENHFDESIIGVINTADPTAAASSTSSVVTADDTPPAVKSNVVTTAADAPPAAKSSSVVTATTAATPAATSNSIVTTTTEEECHDDLSKSFYIPLLDKQYGPIQKVNCFWLQRRMDQVYHLCNPESEIYSICAETCAKCTNSWIEEPYHNNNDYYDTKKEEKDTTVIVPTVVPPTQTTTTTTTALSSSTTTAAAKPTTKEEECKDDTTALFYVDDEQQNCDWLRRQHHPRQSTDNANYISFVDWKELCSPKSDIYYLCAKTCGKCLFTSSSYEEEYNAILQDIDPTTTFLIEDDDSNNDDTLSSSPSLSPTRLAQVLKAQIVLRPPCDDDDNDNEEEDSSASFYVQGVGKQNCAYLQQYPELRDLACLPGSEIYKLCPKTCHNKQHKRKNCAPKNVVLNDIYDKDDFISTSPPCVVPDVDNDTIDDLLIARSSDCSTTFMFTNRNVPECCQTILNDNNSNTNWPAVLLTKNDGHREYVCNEGGSFPRTQQETIDQWSTMYGVDGLCLSRGYYKLKQRSKKVTTATTPLTSSNTEEDEEDIPSDDFWTNNNN